MSHDFAPTSLQAYTDDIPHRTPVDGIEVSCVGLDEASRTAHLTVTRRFPLSSAYAGARFRLGFAVMIPGRGPAFVLSSAFRVHGKQMPLGEPTRYRPPASTDYSTHRETVCHRFAAHCCALLLLKLYASLYFAGTKLKNLRLPQYMELSSDRVRTIQGLQAALKPLKGTLEDATYMGRNVAIEPPPALAQQMSATATEPTGAAGSSVGGPIFADLPLPAGAVRLVSHTVAEGGDVPSAPGENLALLH